MVLRKIVQKIVKKEKELRFLILGLDNAGKTTIIKKINGEDINEVAPTLGFHIKSFKYNEYTLNIWDVGGQKSLRSYWKNYFETTDGLIWVIDSADVDRLEDCRNELHSLLKEERLLGATLLLMANKLDLTDALSVEQLIKALDIERIVSHNYKIIGCSAVTGANIFEGFQWLVDDISHRIYPFDN